MLTHLHLTWHAFYHFQNCYLTLKHSQHLWLIANAIQGSNVTTTPQYPTLVTLWLSCEVWVLSRALPTTPNSLQLPAPYFHNSQLTTWSLLNHMLGSVPANHSNHHWTSPTWPNGHVPPNKVCFHLLFLAFPYIEVSCDPSSITYRSQISLTPCSFILFSPPCSSCPTEFLLALHSVVFGFATLVFILIPFTSGLTLLPLKSPKNTAILD